MDAAALEKDTNFKTYTIAAVEPAVVAEGQPEGWTIRLDDGLSLVMQNVEKVPVPPRQGEQVRLYGKGFGYPVRGVSIEGRVYSYRTAAADEAEHKKRVADQKAQRMLEFAAKLPEFEADIAKLPKPFQDRLAWFRRNKNWQHEFGPYELFSCKEAAKTAERLKTIDAIRDFANQPVAMQKRMVPDLAYDEHSGNTFGSAMRLAAMYVGHPELLAKYHGALCPLVGCSEYGCWAASDEAKAEAAKEGVTRG